MIIPELNVLVGEDVPIRLSFLQRLKDFQSTNQVLTGASIAWTSQSPLLATFDVGSGALVTSQEGAAEGITNDACLGRFTILAAGKCTVKVSVNATNPTATYIGLVQLNIEAIPTS